MTGHDPRGTKGARGQGNVVGQDMNPSKCAMISTKMNIFRPSGRSTGMNSNMARAGTRRVPITFSHTQNTNTDTATSTSPQPHIVEKR